MTGPQPIIVERPAGGKGLRGLRARRAGTHPSEGCGVTRPGRYPLQIMEPAAKRRLGDIFVERCLITPGQLETALQAQRESGGKLGETLVELGFVSRVDLAGVLSEQWADLRVSAARNSPVAEARHTAPGVPTAVEQALRDRLDALTAELAARDQRIAQQDATISALLGQHPTAAQPSAAA
jgi:hypothetical protein